MVLKMEQEAQRNKMGYDYLKFRELYHGDIKQISWKAPKVQTGDGSLYRISQERTLTDAESQAEFLYFRKYKTSPSIKNAFEYLKKQARILNSENEEFIEQRLSEVKKRKSDDKFLEECFKKMDLYPEENRSYNSMRSIIFTGWHSLAGKYASDSLKTKQRQIEKDQRTYSWNKSTIVRDIVGGVSVEDFDVPQEMTNIEANNYRWNVSDAIDGRNVYPTPYDYKVTEETEISDEIAKLYEKSRNIKLPVEG